MKRFSVLLVFLSLLVAGRHLVAQDVGTSTSDDASYVGSFCLENPTTATIYYEYKWGESKPWHKGSLKHGESDTISYPMGDKRSNKIPVPYVRFDMIGGDNAYTAKEYRMEFYAVGYAGFGGGANQTKPKRYFFKFLPDRKTIDIAARPPGAPPFR